MTAPAPHTPDEPYDAEEDSRRSPMGRAIEAPESVASPHLPKAPGDG